MKALWLIIGMLIGSFLGVLFMSLLQINRIDAPERDRTHQQEESEE